MPSSTPPQEPVTEAGDGLLVHSGDDLAGTAGDLPQSGGDLSDHQVRVRLDIAYDGSEFSGWAVQPDRRTVCGVLQTTLAMILRRAVRLTVAGRTDAGVHASGQVAHFDLPADVYAEHERLLPRRLAGLLPPDVRVRRIRKVPNEFDARFSGLSRSYVYRISDEAWGVDPLHRVDVVHWPRPLDTRAMQAASSGLLGLQNFAAYCRRRPESTTIRTLQQLDWGRDSAQTIVAQVQADAFCHSMVRSLVGAMIAVGEGRKPVGWPAALLASDERSSQIAVAPAKGLTLVSVDYPPEHELAARNAVTRNRRDRD